MVAAAAVEEEEVPGGAVVAVVVDGVSKGRALVVEWERDMASTVPCDEDRWGGFAVGITEILNHGGIWRFGCLATKIVRAGGVSLDMKDI